MRASVCGAFGRRRAILLCALVGCVEYGDPIQPPAPEPMAAPRPPSYGYGILPASPPPAITGGAAAPAMELAAESPSATPAAELMEPAEPEPAPGPLPGSPPPDLPLLGTPRRPELDPAVAQMMTLRDYLAQSGDLITGLTRDDWDPSAGGGDVSGFTPDFRVAPSGGSHTSVQDAISQAVAEGGSARRYIQLAAATYREVVCVPSDAPPITLYSLEPDASRTVIAFDNYSGKAKAAGTPANPCSPNTNATSFGTSGSSTFAVLARDFVAKNLTIANDADEDQADGNLQAPALLSQGDRALYDNVRVLGNQDTLLAKSPDVDTVARAYFKSSYIEGDSEFILGRGTLVLDGCTIRSLTSRVSGAVLAPSTDARNRHGFLVTHSTFSADSGADDSSIRLGRAWDENQSDLAAYAELVATGAYPNGQALVRDSVIGAHIDADEPWRSASTSNRPYDSAAGEYPPNRLYEFANTGPGSASAVAP
ncbi:MAG TPA: pectinesterase family protein [Polyangiaceae bacterium]|nr:pectinesterase family protein [Polyangiaceae bacterium]